MPKTINVQGIGLINFPDEFTPQQITDAIEIDILKTRKAAPPPSLDQVVRGASSVPGVTPGVAGGSQPMSTVRLRPSPWERNAAAQAAQQFEQQKTAVPASVVNIPAQQEILNQAGGAELQNRMNGRGDAPGGETMKSIADAVGSANPFKVDPNAANNPTSRIKYALQNSADDPDALVRELSTVPEDKREAALHDAVNALKSDFQSGLANYVPAAEDGEPGGNTVAKSVTRTLLALASPQGQAEVAALGGAGKLIRAGANAPAVAKVLENSPRIRRGLDVASATAVPGGMSVQTGANAIQSGIEAANAENDTERLDKMTSAITSGLISLGLLGSATKAAKSTLGQYPQNAPVPRRRLSPQTRQVLQESGIEIPEETVRPARSRIEPEAARQTQVAMKEAGSNLAAVDWEKIAQSEAQTFPVEAGGQKFTVKTTRAGEGTQPRAFAEVLNEKNERVVSGSPQQVKTWLEQQGAASEYSDMAAKVQEGNLAQAIIRERRFGNKKPVETPAPVAKPAEAAPVATPAKPTELISLIQPAIGEGKPKSIAQLRQESGLDPEAFNTQFRDLYQKGLINANRGDMAPGVDEANYVPDPNGDRPFMTASLIEPAVDPLIEKHGDRIALGNKDEAETAGEGNYAVPVQWALVEADLPVSSHDNYLKPNEAFPEEVQPRDRERAASEVQINGITDESRFRPNRLGYNVMASSGAPILGADDMVVESGNGRTIALRRIYESMPKQADAYRSFLKSKAAMFGLDPTAVDRMKKPMLVRLRSGELPEGISRQQFAVDANADDKAGMAAAEQAMIDSKAITPELLAKFVVNESGKIDTVENQDFIREFLAAAVKPHQMESFMASDGTISKDGLARIRNAMFARAYGDPSAVEKLAEDTNPEIGNVINGMLLASPKMATLQAAIESGVRHPLGINEEITRATFKMSSLRRQKKNIEDYLNQQDLEGRDPVEHGLLESFHQFRRSPKRIGQILNNYADAVDAAGDPNQMSMFGDPVPSKLDILDAVVRDVKDQVEAERLAKAGQPGEVQQSPVLAEEPANGPIAVGDAAVAPAQAEAPVVETPASPVRPRRVRGNKANSGKESAAPSTRDRRGPVGDSATAVQPRGLAQENGTVETPSQESSTGPNPQSSAAVPSPDSTAKKVKPVSPRRRKTQEGSLKFFTGNDEPADNDPAVPFDIVPEKFQKRIREAAVPTPPRAEEESAWRQIGRVFRHLPNGKYPVLVFELKRLEKVGQISNAKSQEAVRSITMGLKPNQFHAFRMRVVMDDMLATLDRFLADGVVELDEVKDQELAFGFSLDELREAQAKHQAYTDAIPEIKKAIEKREKVWADVRNEFLKQMDAAGVDMREKFKNKDYFRHRVLTHMQDKLAAGTTGTTPGVQTPVRRSHFMSRGFNTLDYSTNYIESEYEVLSQMIADTQKARMVAYLKAPSSGLNIIDNLKAEARRLNIEAMFEHFKKSGMSADGINALVNWRRDSIVDLMGELAFSGSMPAGENEEFRPLVDELAQAYETAQLMGEDAAVKTRLKSKPEEFARYSAWLRQYLQQSPLDIDRKIEPGEIQMRRAARAITAPRRIPDQMLKDILKNRMVAWSDLIPETHKAWAPQDGNTFFMTNSIPEQLAAEIMESIGGTVGVTKDDLKRVLAVGPKKEPFVLPREVANTLDDLRTDAQKNRIYIGVRKAIGGWKSFQLVSPLRLVKYNLRNLSGDAEVTLTGNPGAFLKVPRATKELWDWYRKREGTPDLEAWMERGGFQYSLTIQELGDLANDAQFRKLMEKDGLPKGERNLNPWKAWTEHVGRPVSEFREGILRYANFLDYLEQAKTGKTRNYGASRPSDIDALRTPADKAYKLSNDLLGAYDEITEGGRVIRDMFIPFWSFQELNFRRYKWLFKNAAHDGHIAGAIGRKLLGKAAFKAPYIAYRVGSIWFKVFAFWSILQAFNHLWYSKEEAELPKSIRERPHIILGRNSATGKVYYFSRLGNLPDLLEWFDPEDYVPLVKDLLNGKISPGKFASMAAEKVYMPPIEKLVTTGAPYVSIPYQFATGKRNYPDIQHPRQIRDRAEFVAEQFQMQGLYQWLAGKPMGPSGSMIPDGIKKSLLYEADPKESAYYDIRDIRTEFMAKKGVAEGPGSVATDPRKEAAYNLKIAIRRQDVDAFRRYLQAYYDAGGNRTMLEKSVETFDPLYKMKKSDRKEFIESLNDEDKHRLVLAQQYYREIFKSGRLQEYLNQSRDIRRTK